VRVQGSGFIVQGSGLRAKGSGFKAWGSGLRVQGLGSLHQHVYLYGVWRKRCCAVEFSFRVKGLGFRV